MTSHAARAALRAAGTLVLGFALPAASVAQGCGPNIRRALLEQAVWDRCTTDRQPCVTLAYRHVLARDPSASDLSYWMAQPPHTRDEYVAFDRAWLASPAGAGDLEALVNRLGRKVFGRAPNTTEKAQWAAVARQGQQDYYAQSDSLAGTLHDTDQGSGERRAVNNRAYLSAYGRFPTNAELDAVPQCTPYEGVVGLLVMHMYAPEGATELTGTIRRAWLSRWHKQPTQAQISAWITPAGASQMPYDQLKTTVQ
jgi:hypothetical protein